MAELPEHLIDYRKVLVTAEQKSQEDFDKTVLSLSGGALGISFVFLKDVVGANPIQLPGWLIGSWISWALSTLCVLASFFLSHMALREAIRQVDDGSIANSKPGGSYSFATAVLNILGAFLFVVGVISITVFASTNISSRGATNATTQAAASTASAASSTASAASSTASAASSPGSSPASTAASPASAGSRQR